jgi:hypothetical protein
MSPISSAIHQAALELSAEERLELVEALWQSLEPPSALWQSLEPPSTTLPAADWLSEALEERYREDEASTDEGASWAEVKARVLASL